MSYETVIRKRLDAISELTGEKYGLNFNRYYGGYMFYVILPGNSGANPSKVLFCSLGRMPGREMYRYLQGVLSGARINGRKD